MARVNTTKAVAAWINGRYYRAPGRNGSPIWTMNGVLYSYQTPIAKFSDTSDRLAIVNLYKYSVTTSCQQGGVMQLLAEKGIRVLVASGEQFNLTERE